MRKMNKDAQGKLVRVCTLWWVCCCRHFSMLILLTICFQIFLNKEGLPCSVPLSGTEFGDQIAFLHAVSHNRFARHSPSRMFDKYLSFLLPGRIQQFLSLYNTHGAGGTRTFRPVYVFWGRCCVRQACHATRNDD